MNPTLLDKYQKSNPTLWRYMSLDKYLSLLSTKSLFFTGLGNYVASDPAEGSLPRPIVENILNHHMDDYIKTVPAETLMQWKNPKKDLEGVFKFKLLSEMQNWSVSCWQTSEHESEAMWKLYTDINKGVAIRTDFKSLYLAMLKDTEQYPKVEFDAVKYVNFSSYEPSEEELKAVLPKPIYKSESYKHEEEFRFFIKNTLELPNTKKIEPTLNSLTSYFKSEMQLAQKKCQSVSCDPIEYIQEVIISPYTSEPFDTVVKDISKLYGIKENIVRKSELLKGFFFLTN